MEAVGRVRVGAGADAVAVRINGKRRVSRIVVKLTSWPAGRQHPGGFKKQKLPSSSLAD